MTTWLTSDLHLGHENIIRYCDRPFDDGRWLLHGHVHERWRVEHRQISVGVEVWDYAPVDAATLRGLVVEAGAAPEAAGGQVAPVAGP